MGHTRRALLIGLLALLPSAAFAHPGLHRHPHRGARRRRIRRRVHRRRVRRRVRWRVVAGRRLLVVPLAVAVGWELALDDRIVVVKEVHGETLVVVHADGKRETVEIVREDTDENARELEGSTYEVEIEEEVDE